MAECLVCKNKMDWLVSFPNGRSVYKCRRCGLRSLLPLAEEEERKSFYDRDEYYKEEIADLHNDLVYSYRVDAPIIKLYRKHIKNLIFLKAAPARLLEIGCARGVFLDLAKKNEYEVSGIEMNSYAVNYAKEKFGLNVEKKSIEELDTKACLFDIIVALDVIEHLLNPKLLLEKSRGLLKPGGILLIGTPNSRSLINWVAESAALLTNSSYYYPLYRFYGKAVEHLNIFNPYNLDILAKEFYFQKIKSYLYNIPLNNMCNVNILQRLMIGILSTNPYEFVSIFKKTD
ncbi:MAG: class I SAM-dependent methyltransferase [Candidatus Omnitrophica bacterium]|nr:class I SAM-dependent methyltransferase [Candidatus Omnitrophota bacterium]MBU1869903.1 class I SAM-dependent methyltransferase [Candidatus Omnitrophota bacterium]